MASESSVAHNETIARLLRNRILADAYATGVARRDAHPKAHGLVSATFTVHADVPESLRHGLFAQPGTYDAWIRLSNGFPKAQADTKKDQRGFAIKLRGVAGEKLVVDPTDPSAHDFVLASAPFFFIRTANDYVRFVAAQVKRPAWRVLGFFFNPLRPRVYEFRRLLAAATHTDDLLTTRYWSQVPYRLGPHVVKYSVRPQNASRPWPASRHPDYLRARLRSRLRESAASFDFAVQVQTDASTMPVDDSTVKWDEEKAPFHPVATIALPQQEIESNDRAALVDRLAFSPWHALPAHEPLGPMNSIRREVYRAVAAARLTFNDKTGVEMGGQKRVGFWSGVIVALLVVILIGAFAFWRMGRGADPVTLTVAQVPPNTTGLSPEERAQYYHLSEGGEIYPVAALLALETPDPARPGQYVSFLSTAERYGLLPDPVSTHNPYGLPVGVTVAQRGSLQMIGLNCTACHVGELTYRGQRFRVDGAPSIAFINSFIKAIVDETKATFDPGTPERAARFFRRLRGARALLKPLPSFPAVDHEYGATDVATRTDPFDEGDDVSSFLRETFARFRDRDGILEARIQGIRNAGFLTGSFLISPRDGFGRADAFGVGRNALFGAVHNAAVGFPRGTNSAPSDAPVSFPHIWGMEFTSWLQWGANTNSVMERNVGQSLGVGAAYDPDTFVSTVRVDHIAAMERLSYKIQAPQWPENIFGSIDRAKAAAGKAVFDQTCALCHETYSKTPEGLKEFRLFPLHVVGTDPATALNFERLVLPFADPEAKPFGTAAFTVVQKVLQKYYDDKQVPDDVRARWERRDLRPNPEFRSPLRQSDAFPDTRGFKVYRSKTLRGIWATAPYLHNGSVPTIYDLLLPASRRPKSFTVGTHEYDPVKLGLAADGPVPPGMQPTTVDTTLPGNWNTGHEWWFYPTLTDTDRYNIIEFLKTFWLPNDADYQFESPAALPAEVRAPYRLEPPPPTRYPRQ
jgi:hypothetical protein